MTRSEETDAFNFFCEVHDRLGHQAEYCTHEAFDKSPLRKTAWIEIVRVVNESDPSKFRWLDEYAFTLFVQVHTRLNDSYIGNLSREEFDGDGGGGYRQNRKLAWCEIARVADERQMEARAKAMEKVLC